MWEDAYGLLRQCQEDMSSSQILKLPSFQLLNAMAAVDVVDLPRENTSTQSPFNPYCPINPHELICIMDRLLILQMSFQAGQPLSKTLSTCKYMQLRHNHLFLPQIHISLLSVLKVYLVAVAKTVDLVWCELRTEVIRENEDVLTLDKGSKIYLAEDESITNILDSLKESIQWVKDQEDANSLDSRISFHIRCRLLFRWELLYHLLNFYSNHGISPSFSSCLSVWPDTWEIHESLRPDLEQTELSSNIIREAFDTVNCVQQTSASPTKKIISSTQLLTFEQSKKDIELWLNQLDELCLFSHAQSHSFVSFWIFFTSSSSLKPELTVHSRSVYQNKLFSENRFMNDRYPTEWLAQHYLKECYQSSTAALDEMIVYPESRLILNKISSLLTQHLNMLCDNIPRRRRKLANSMVDWENLWFEIINYNNSLVNSPFFVGESTPQKAAINPECIRLQQLETAIQCILDGFELDLYSTNELVVMWWLLVKICEKIETIVYNFQIVHSLSKVPSTTPTIPAMNTTTSMTTEEGGESNNEQYRKQDSPPTYLQLLNLWAKGLRNLSNGAILMHEVIPQVIADLTTDKLRFERRVKWMPSKWTHTNSFSSSPLYKYKYRSPPSSPLSLNAFEQLPLFSRATKALKGISGSDDGNGEKSKNTSLPEITWNSFLSFKENVKTGEKESALSSLKSAKNIFTALVEQQPKNNYYRTFLNISTENISRFECFRANSRTLQTSEFVSSPWSSFLVNL